MQSHHSPEIPPTNSLTISSRSSSINVLRKYTVNVTKKSCIDFLVVGINSVPTFQKGVTASWNNPLLQRWGSTLLDRENPSLSNSDGRLHGRDEIQSKTLEVEIMSYEILKLTKFS